MENMLLILESVTIDLLGMVPESLANQLKILGNWRKINIFKEIKSVRHRRRAMDF